MISILPLSILEKSRTPFMRESRVLLAFLIFAAYSRTSSSWDSLSIISSIPITAFIGVLISWLICARKSDFALPATVAFSTASESCLFIFACDLITLFTRVIITMMKMKMSRTNTTTYMIISPLSDSQSNTTTIEKPVLSSTTLIHSLYLPL